MQAEKIMVVDDNKIFLDEIREILSLTGYRVICLEDSARVLNCAAKMRPDLVLLDLKMREKSGFDVARELKKSESTSGIPILAMSGHFPVDTDGALFEKRFIGFLKKPFAVTDLITQIEKILSRRKDTLCGSLI